MTSVVLSCIGASVFMLMFALMRIVQVVEAIRRDVVSIRERMDEDDAALAELLGEEDADVSRWGIPR